MVSWIHSVGCGQPEVLQRAFDWQIRSNSSAENNRGRLRADVCESFEIRDAEKCFHFLQIRKMGIGPASAEKSFLLA